MFTRNQWMLIVIIGVALVAPMGAIYYMHHQSKHVIESWGAEVASSFIKGADRVELMSVELIAAEAQAAGAEDNLNKNIRVLKKIDITKGQGVTNMRHAIVQDFSYEWDATPSTETPNWQYAVRLFKNEKSIVLLFDSAAHLLAMLDSEKKPAVLSPKIAKGMVTVFKEQFELHKK